MERYCPRRRGRLDWRCGSAAYCFDDGAAYERFMGRWSRGAGEVFLEWLAPPLCLLARCRLRHRQLTELIVDRCAPSAVSAIDPERAQTNTRAIVRWRSTLNFGWRRAGTSFADHTFDVVASGLVLNFVPDPDLALLEMVRVARSGAIVGAYVWDFAEDLSPTWPFRLGLRELGVAVAPTPGAENSRLSALKRSFEHAGLKEVANRSIDVVSKFSDFEDVWISQTPNFNPIARQIAALEMNERTRLIEAVRAKVLRPDGSIEYVARANAVSGRRPKADLEQRSVR